MQNTLKIVLVVPTGVGASIGGYAGDAGVLTRYLSGLCERIITHPNVLNAAMFNEAPPNVDYIEGFYLDGFFNQTHGFKQESRQKIGVVIDRRCQELFYLIENAVHATMLSTGCHVMGYAWTDSPLDISFFPTDYGYGGEVGGAEQLLKAGQDLLDQGATALAVLTYMDLLDEGEDADYLSGQSIDPIGGLEANVSHYLASELKVPVAHSPIFEPHNTKTKLHPRVAAEEIGHTFLPCILKGLHRAPAIVDYAESDIHLDEISAVIAPWNAVGGIPMLRAVELGIPLILVKENTTLLNVTPESLNLPMDQIYLVDNYWEAAGLLLAFKTGLDPAVLRCPYESSFKNRSLGAVE